MEKITPEITFDDKPMEGCKEMSFPWTCLRTSGGTAVGSGEDFLHILERNQTVCSSCDTLMDNTF